MVDEDTSGVGLRDGSCDFAQSLAHQASLKSHLVVAHVAFDFRLRREGSHRVNDDDVDGRRANQLVGNFQGLLTVVGLRDVEIVDVYPKFFGVEAVESVFCIDEGCNTSALLCFSNGMDSKRGLTRGFGTVDFDDAAARIATHSQHMVETDGACRDHLHVFHFLVAHFHDRPFTEVLFDVGHCSLQCFEFIRTIVGE